MFDLVAAFAEKDALLTTIIVISNSDVHIFVPSAQVSKIDRVRVIPVLSIVLVVW